MKQSGISEVFVRVLQRLARPCALGLCVWAMTLTPATSSASAQDATARANEPYKQIRRGANEVDPGLRSDLRLLPVVAQMEAAPVTFLAGVAESQAFRILDERHPRWDALAAWAQSEPQRRVLRVLAEITEETDPRLAMGFGLPYGQDGLIDLIGLGLGDEIENLMLFEKRLQINVLVLDTPLLATADLSTLYENAIRPVIELATIEAIRLASERRVAEALDVLTNLAYFGRQLVDRELGAEQRIGYTIIMFAMERIRDLAYIDSERRSPSLAAEPVRLKAVLDRLARLGPNNERGFLEFSRAELPLGDKLAAIELAEHSMPGGFADPQRFASAMAVASGNSLSGDTSPLRLLGEMTYWEQQAPRQASKADTISAIERVWGDIDTRWKRDEFFGESRRREPELSRLDAQSYRIVRTMLSNALDMIAIRQMVRTEVGGTRVALAVLARRHAQGVYGMDVTAGATDWLNRIVDKDPYHPDFRVRDWASSSTNFKYSRVTTPVRMDIDSNSGAFTRTLTTDEGVFLLYSVGPDHADGAARRIRNSAVAPPGAAFDYLIWPPLVSLERQYLRGE